MTNLDFARAQMALSLAFHIVFVAVGIPSFAYLFRVFKGARGAARPAVSEARPGSVRGVSGDPGGGR